MASTNINEKVQQALEEGHAWEDIKAHLSTLDNPEAKSYLSGLKTATSSNPSASNVQTGLIDWAQANPQDALLYGAGAYAALQAPKIASKVADYRLKQRELGLKERSLAAYESQVAKQGAPASDLLNPKDELINSVRQNEFDQQKPATSNVQDQIAQERLRQAQLKTQRAEVEHQNWLAKNTLSEAEQAFGRKAKDPAELRLMQTAVQQQAGKGPVSPTPGGPAPMAELPVIQSPAATTPPAQTWGAPVNQAPVAPTNVAPAPVAPPAAPIETTPAITQPANVLSTGPTAESAEAPIKKVEVIKEVTTPSSEKPVSKAKKPIDPSEAGLTKQEIGMKRYLESFYGGGEVGAKTYGQVGEILGYRPAFEPGKGGGLKPEENLIIKGYRKENIAGPKVNLDKEMKRALKGGAAVGALMAIPGFADAAQKKDYGRMADIASDFLVPTFAGSTELGVSTLGEKQLKAYENAQKLGSPYRAIPPR
jgi:hypothetical protein